MPPFTMLAKRHPLAIGFQYPDRGHMRNNEFSGGEGVVIPQLSRLGFEIRDTGGNNGDLTSLALPQVSDRILRLSRLLRGLVFVCLLVVDIRLDSGYSGRGRALRAGGRVAILTSSVSFPPLRGGGGSTALPRPRIRPRRAVLANPHVHRGLRSSGLVFSDRGLGHWGQGG